MKKRAEIRSRWNAVRVLGGIALAVALAFIFAKTDLPALAWGISARILNYAYNDITHNNSEGLFNQIIGIGIIIGAIFAAWRIRAMNRQAAAAEGGHRDGRFEKGAEMMSADVLTARIGGIAALDRLAKEYPSEYHVQCNKMLCAFVRYRFADEESGQNPVDETRKCRPDIEIATQIIALRKMTGKNIIEKTEKIHNYIINLSGANLFEAYLRYSDFSKSNLINVQFGSADLSFSNIFDAWLTNSKFNGAILFDVDFSYARLIRTDLKKANMESAKLLNASLHDANLNGANLASATLFNAKFMRSNLKGARLDGANLCGAELLFSDLTAASLNEADFRGIELSEVDLSGTIMRNVRNLDQAELDKCFIKKGMNEPDLEDSKCAKSGRPLEWRGPSR